jgi:hypothetical protein
MAINCQRDENAKGIQWKRIVKTYPLIKALDPDSARATRPADVAALKSLPGTEMPYPEFPSKSIGLSIGRCTAVIRMVHNQR